jgi:3'(2'), 5'-bisphosphate nucleotidase
VSGDSGPSDHEVAAELATGAGQVLLEVRRRALSTGRTGKDLKDAGDARAQAWLAARLAELRPHDAVLSEEAADDPARLGADRVWIIDPLDGTREFSEPERSDWAVHVALWQRTGRTGGDLVAGAVALPAQGYTLATGHALPALTAPTRRPRLLASRTRPSEHATALAVALDADLVPMGSAGAKAMAVVTGEADVYAHSGGQYEWDSAAPVAVAAAAGLHVSRLDGSTPAYNQPDPYLPDVLVCHPALAAKVLTALAALPTVP